MSGRSGDEALGVRGLRPAELDGSATAARPERLVSFVIPAFQSPKKLAAAVASIRASAEDLSHEIIVVDDGSVDETYDVALEVADTFVARPCQGGAARARNDGSKVASGVFLFFVDADVTVNAAAVRGALQRLDEGADAVFGAYKPLPPVAVRNRATEFKNLIHHHTHVRGAGDASTFWSGFGAVRRDAFSAVGGFDASTTTTADVEDIDLGYRLTAAGFRIVLDPQLQVEHHKRYRFRDVVGSDVFHRAIPWTRLILAGRAPRRTHLNLSAGAATSSLVAAAVPVAAIASIWVPAALAVGAGLILTWAWLQRPFIGYARRVVGVRRASTFTVFLYLYSLSCLVGAALGVAAFVLRHNRRSTLNVLDADTTSEVADGELAVTVAVIGNGHERLAALDGLPAVDGRWELLVVSPVAPAALPEGARWVPAPAGSTRHAMRERALDEANGQMLALLDAECRPLDGWLDRVHAAARRAHLAVGGSFAHDRRGPRARARQIAMYWPFRPERPARPSFDHPLTNFAVRTDMARRLGGFEPPGMLARRLAGFGARPVAVDPAMAVSFNGHAGVRDMLHAVAGAARLGAEVGTRYLDLSLAHRLLIVSRRPFSLVRQVARTTRQAVAEGTSDSSFWTALPLACVCLAAAFVGEAVGFFRPRRGRLDAQGRDELAVLIDDFNVLVSGARSVPTATSWSQHGHSATHVWHDGSHARLDGAP